MDELNQLRKKVAELERENSLFKDTEKQHKKAQAIGHVGNWEYNPVSTNFWASDEAKRIYGYDLSLENFSTDIVESCIPERERVNKALLDLLEYNKKYDLIFDIITYDKGIRKTIHSIAELERDAQGNPLKITGVINDITIHKRTEDNLKALNQQLQAGEQQLRAAVQQLQASEQQLIAANQQLQAKEYQLRVANEELNRAQEITHVGSWYLDIATNEVVWSNELYKMYGFDPELPVPSYHEHMKLFTPESWELLSASLAQTVENGIPYELELRTVRKDSSNGWMWVIGEAFYDENKKIVGLWGAAQDITVRKSNENELQKAKEKAQESEEKYKALYENAPLSYQSLNEDGSFNDVNPTWLSTLGYKREEVIGKFYKDFLHPDWKSHFEKNFPAFKKRGYVNDVQFKIRHKNGHYLDISFEGCIGYNPDGSFKQTYCVFQDITEKKQALEELVIAKEKAEEADRLKTVFLANMSHEIRTPMNGILGFTSLLLEPDLTGEEQLNFIDIIQKSGNRMLSTVNDIIDISKIESGLVELSVSEVNITEQLNYLHSFFNPEAAKNGTQLVINNEISDHDFIINTDSEKLNSILTNLIKNAIKFTTKGTIEVGCSLKNDNGQKYIEFYVKDTGIGVQKDRQAVIFDRFVQADIEDKHAKQGSGLGLAISKAYAQMLGGRIWLESKVGLGSTFYFTIKYNSQSDLKLDLKKTSTKI